MKRTYLLGLSLALVLVGCAAQQGRGTPERPLIIVAGGKVERVSPEPLRFKPKKGAVVIHWDAPAGHRFTGRGIVIEGEVERIGGPIIDKNPSEVGRCVVTGNQQQVQCTNARTRDGIYKYTVLLQQSDGKELPPFDPHIVNKD